MLDAILNPRAVAVIGASDTPARIGGRPIFMMQDAGFAGRIYPVNPNRDVIQGMDAYGSISDVPEPVDCAIVAVPAGIALDAVRECAAAGVRSLVMFTSGFAEIDADGESAQRELARIVQSSGMRVLGPNCLGVFNLRAHWYGTFANVLGMTRVPSGPVGIVTQSGAYGAHVYVAAQKRGLGANYWVTTGNEVDIGVGEVIEHFVADDDVRVILAYAEGMKDPDRVRRAFAAAREAGKPVVFMKVGKTDAGARAAQSHTASLAGSDAIYDALFRQYGVYRADTTEELVDVAYACQFGRYPRGRRVSLQTVSGGVGVQMADAAVERGLDVAPMPAETQARIKALMPLAGANNPVDFTGQAVNEPALMDKCVRLSFAEPGYDAHIIYLAGATSSPFLRDEVAKTFSGIREDFNDKVLFMSAFADPEVTPRYEAMGYPYFEDPSLAVRALGALTWFGESFARPSPASDRPGSDRARSGAAGTDSAAPPLPGTASEHESKRILASAGIAVAPEQLVTDRDAARSAAAQFDGPVVMKIVSADIAHKTEMGGVLLDIDGADAVADGFDLLMARAASARPDAVIDGVLIAPMVTDGVETVLGVVRDPLFGPAVMFGLGGVFVEVLKDVAFRLAPFDLDEAYRMIDEIRGRPMLDGVRGAPPSDIAALARTLVALSDYAHRYSDSLETIDINPFIVLPHGAVAVDALVIGRETE